MPTDRNRTFASVQGRRGWAHTHGCRLGQAVIGWVALLLLCLAPMSAVSMPRVSTLRHERRLQCYDLALARALGGLLLAGDRGQPGVVMEEFSVEGGARSRVATAREGDQAVLVAAVETGQGTHGFRIAYGAGTGRELARELWLAWKQALKDPGPVQGNLPLARLARQGAMRDKLEPDDRQKLGRWLDTAIPDKL